MAESSLGWLNFARCLRSRLRSGKRRGGAVGRGIGQLKGELASGAHGLVVAFVGFDDALHQGVADHVLFVELHEADAFDAAQHVHRIGETAAAAVGQIDLGDGAVSLPYWS